MCGRVSLLRRLSGALAVTALVALSGGTGRASSPTAPRDSLVDGGQKYYPEVRLRKLHLVRPDLIPYPISFEIYC